jgi:hypothetical protein
MESEKIKKKMKILLESIFLTNQLYLTFQNNLASILKIQSNSNYIFTVMSKGIFNAYT